MTSPQFPRRAHQRAGGILTPAQFWAICQIARTSDPSREAARLVLVEGRSQVDARSITGVEQPSISRLVGRLLRAHNLIADAYRQPIDSRSDIV